MSWGDHKENSELGIQLNIHRALMFYLAAKIDKTVSEIACTLIDQANKSIERMKEGNNWQNRNRFKYPDTNIMINATVSKAQDDKTYVPLAEAWIRSFLSHPNLVKENYKRGSYWDNYGKCLWPGGIHSIAKKHNMRTWINENPYPEYDNFWCLKCTFTLSTKDRNIVFTQQNIDDMLIENILFGEEDKDGNT